MGYQVLEATFYFSLWKSTYGLVKNISLAVEIDNRHTMDIVL
jgi:hypothetical protein